MLKMFGRWLAPSKFVFLFGNWPETDCLPMLKSNIVMAIQMAIVLFAIGSRMLITSFSHALLPNLCGAVAENCSKLTGTLLLLWIYSPSSNVLGSFQAFSLDVVCGPELGALDH
jgi:hypothetical protein